MRRTLYFFIIGILSCRPQTHSKKHIADPLAIKLNDSAVNAVIQRKDYREAISLLNQATQIDSNYFLAYTNKLSFQLVEKQFDNALKTATRLNRIRPNAPDYYVTIGILNELNGDTVKSKVFYTEASKRYNAILDTMSSLNKEYDMFSINKAINLILIGQQQKGNDLLIEIYNRQKDSSYKEMLSTFMNKSKRDILKFYTSNRVVDYGH